MAYCFSPVTNIPRPLCTRMPFFHPSCRHQSALLYDMSHIVFSSTPPLHRARIDLALAIINPRCRYSIEPRRGFHTRQEAIIKKSTQPLIRLVHGSSDLTDYPGRAPCDNMEWRNVPCHDPASSDGASPADGDTTEDDDVPSDPAIFPDGNGLLGKRPQVAVAHDRVEMVRSAVEAIVWSYDGARTDDDGRAVVKGAVPVQVRALSQEEIESVFRAYGRHDARLACQQGLVVCFRGRPRRKGLLVHCKAVP